VTPLVEEEGLDAVLEEVSVSKGAVVEAVAESVCGFFTELSCLLGCCNAQAAG